MIAFWIIIGFSLLMLYVVTEGPLPSLPRRKVKPKALTVEDRLSQGGKVVLQQFRLLPEENRPYSEDELIAVLRAFDVKWEWSEVNSHFEHWDYYASRYYDTYCSCGKLKKCSFTDHAGMLIAIKKIRDALAQREHDLLVANVAPDLDRAAELTMRLHQEAAIVKDVTEQLL